MSPQPSIDSFRWHAAGEVAITCSGLGIEAEDVDVVVSVAHGCAQIIVRDREFGPLFKGGLRVGRASDDLPLLTAAQLRSDIAAELARVRSLK
ncbi:hypothetical protein I5U65_07475 [Stenotrophomonas maltophilia]|nr:hypothetical protein [Stenotrophomonas maltophilia]